MLSDTLDYKSWSIVKTFLKKNYNSNYIFLKKTVFDYYFLDKKKKQYNLINYKKKNKILGILGYIPNKFVWDNSKKIINGVWTANWIVDKNYRSGLGVILMRRLQEKYDLIMGIGANEYNKKIVSKMNNQFFKSIPRLLIYPDHKRMKYLDIKLPKKSFKVGNFDNVSLANEKKIKKKFKLSLKRYSIYKFGTLRSANYIIKRFLKYPFFKYNIIISGNKNTSLLIYRVEHIKSINKKIIRILDLITTKDKNGKINSTKLINYVKRLLLNKNMLFADFFCTNNEINNIFKKNGFIRYDNKVVDIPIKFNPIVRKDRNQNLEVFCKQKIKFNFNSSYITKSDGDQDRIN